MALWVRSIAPASGLRQAAKAVPAVETMPSPEAITTAAARSEILRIFMSFSGFALAPSPAPMSSQQQLRPKAATESAADETPPADHGSDFAEGSQVRDKSLQTFKIRRRNEHIWTHMRQARHQSAQHQSKRPGAVALGRF